MLCCGLLAMIAAAIAGSWRLLRPARLFVLIGSAAALLAIPVIALGTVEKEAPLSRADVIARSMHTLCGPTPY
ncbi:MAG: hypothetical protein ABWZ75_09355 [Novosphingobium sp.]